MSGALPEEAVQAEGIVQRLKAARDRKLAICWAAAAAVLLLLAVCLLPLPRRLSATHEGLLWRCGTPEETQSTTVTVNGIYDDYLFRTDTFTGSVWVEDCPETHGALSITKLGENQYGIWYETPQSRLNAFGSLFIRKDGSLMVIIDEDGHWDGATGRMLTAPASTREEAVALANELNFTILGLTFSPVKGPEGNIEFLGHLTLRDIPGIVPDTDAVVTAAHEKLKG